MAAKKKIIEIEAESLEEAREQVKSQIPQGLSMLSEKIISDGRPKTVKRIAETVEAAYAKAQNEIPNGADVVETKELANPERKVVTVVAFDESSAREQTWKQIHPANAINAIIKTTKLVTSGSKGFLGIGKKLNLYEVEVLHQAVVEITYKTKAKISAEIGKAKAKSNEHYMLKCVDCDFTHHIPRNGISNTLEYSVDVDEVKLVCFYGGVFTVTLEVKEFFTITNVPGSNPALYASIVDNMNVLHGHMLSHCDPLFLIIKQSSNQTTHKYNKHPKGNTYVKFSKEHGVDIVGNIDVSKAEIPGVSYVSTNESLNAAKQTPPVKAAQTKLAPIDICKICGQQLNPKISGQIAKFLELDWWPCPKCHMYSSTIIVSDRGIAAERNPLLVTIRRNSDKSYEILVGIGSITNPAKNPLGKDQYLGRHAFFSMIDALNPANESKLVEMLKQ